MQSRTFFVLKIIPILAVFFFPFAMVLYKDKTPQATGNPLARAGRKVYENSGCPACHTRYVRKNLADLVRYAPNDYTRLYLKKENTLSERVDATGIRIGPDLEYLPYILIDQDYFARYITDPLAMNPHSAMPSFKNLFREKLTNDEILFASGTLKNKHGYGIYTRGDALLYYLKVSTLNFYGRLK